MRLIPTVPSGHLTSASFTPGTVLPTSTHLSGRITVVWTKLTSETISVPRIAFRLECEMIIDSMTVNDYARSAPNGSKAVFLVHFALRPRGLQEGTSGTAAARLISQMESDQKILMDLQKTGRLLNISCDGLRVVRVERLEKSTGVHLEGSGERTITSKSKGITTILSVTPPLDPPIDSATPSWFATPSLPSIPSPSQAKTTLVETIAQPESGPSRLRPLSAHTMPTFAMRALRVKDDKGASVEKRKRSPSPKLIPESGKKSRLHEKKEEAQMAVTGTSNDSETETTQAETGGRAGSTSSTRNEDKSVEGKASVADTAKVGYAGAGACESVTVVRLGPAPRTWEVQAPILAKTAGTPPVGRSLSPNKPSLERSSGLNSGVSSAQDATRIQEADIVRPTAEDAVAVRRRQEAVVKEERRRAIEAERKIGRRAGARARAGAEAELRLEEQGGGQQRTEEDSAGLKRAFDVSGFRYTPIAELEQGLMNVVGVVVQIHPPKQTRTQDWTTTIVVADPSSHTDGFQGDDFLVTVFRKTIAELPTSLAPGTPILFRGIKVTYWQGKLKGQAFSPDGGFSKNTWASLPGGKGVQLANPQHMHLPIGKAELDRLTGLWRWWGGTNDGESAEPSAREEPNVHQVPDRRASIVTNGESGKQSLTLGEVSQGVFFNGTFKIVHMVINTPPKPALELYITDGTVSPSTTRNFHNVDIGIPASAIFSLAIKNTPPTTERDVFQVDNIITMNNIRAKAYQGDLELIWSELVTEEQKAQGWNRRRCHTLQAGDEIAKVIEARIKALKQGDLPPSVPEQHLPPPREMPSVSCHTLATHISTVHTDPIEHPITPLALILCNSTLPNKFRLRARVKSVHSRGLAGNDNLVQQHCCKCRRYFPGGYCQSCNDVDLHKAELRYRFVALLAQDDLTVPIIVADEEAAAFLPPLPPMSTSTNPNDRGKTLQQIREASAQTLDILLGAKIDGVRPRPVIDLSVEMYEVRQKEKGVVVLRVFGMKSL